MKTLLISITGFEGIGEPVQHEGIFLAERLRTLGMRVACVDFPRLHSTQAGQQIFKLTGGGENFGRGLTRNGLRWLSELYAQEHRESLSHLRWSMSNNDIVFLKGYVGANILYHGCHFFNASGSAAGVEEFALRLLYLEHFEYGLPRPDIQFYVDLPMTVANDRARARAKQNTATWSDLKQVASGYSERMREVGRFYAAKLRWHIVPGENAGKALAMVDRRDYMLGILMRQL